MIELLLPCGIDTLEYSWVKATIGIYTLADNSVAKKHQHWPRGQDLVLSKRCPPPRIPLFVMALPSLPMSLSA
jgi:hypothetical protein